MIRDTCGMKYVQINNNKENIMNDLIDTSNDK